jgi:hypothetical protein
VPLALGAAPVTTLMKLVVVPLALPTVGAPKKVGRIMTGKIATVLSLVPASLRRVRTHILRHRRSDILLAAWYLEIGNPGCPG